MAFGLALASSHRPRDGVWLGTSWLACLGFGEGSEILLARRKTGYASPYRIASLYCDLGDKEQAFRWLNIAYQERDWQLGGLNSDFYIDPLRSDPRFAELVRKVGLPQ